MITYQIIKTLTNVAAKTPSAKSAKVSPQYNGKTPRTPTQWVNSHMFNGHQVEAHYRSIILVQKGAIFTHWYGITKEEGLDKKGVFRVEIIKKTLEDGQECILVNYYLQQGGIAEHIIKYTPNKTGEDDIAAQGHFIHFEKKVIEVSQKWNCPDCGRLVTCKKSENQEQETKKSCYSCQKNPPLSL
ncbi:MAG: hypothetical protein G01um101418_863 [Parcubacteria group bacterium Gr01-1014_18]|nr:MAG: hypothetical protein Greene041636_823 [Parcubacteria group bacterium Greene0416_36]TSC79864.1 MAG: hypothetical protein G01um101418_863 [Parcubacteria group bacterium Gr01-1014_18]TSC98296.1 MAG: hypothetical protein Greene101420_800 [Parcubacteria group bacterium Greene1014_20]TSD06663.1 MAG: hypothetical protein Greene07142_715 [Parcubacteria group bacterium Greene0714_2]